MLNISNVAFIDLELFAIVVVLVMLAIFAFEVAMLVHVIRNAAITENTKILWVVGMLLVHPIVAIVYYFTDYKKV